MLIQVFRLIWGHLARLQLLGATRSPTPQGWGINQAAEASACGQSSSLLGPFIYSLRRRDPAYFDPAWWGSSHPCLPGEWGQKQGLRLDRLGVRLVLSGT